MDASLQRPQRDIDSCLGTWCGDAFSTDVAIFKEKKAVSSILEDCCTSSCSGRHQAGKRETQLGALMCSIDFAAQRNYRCGSPASVRAAGLEKLCL